MNQVMNVIKEDSSAFADIFTSEFNKTDVCFEVIKEEGLVLKRKLIPKTKIMKLEKLMVLDVHSRCLL